MSAVGSFQEYFSKIVAKIGHHHDVKEREKSAIVRLVRDIEKRCLHALESGDIFPSVDTDTFDSISVKENKSLKRLVHDTAKSIKKFIHNYEKEHPKHIHSEKDSVQEDSLHVNVEEGEIMPEPTKDQLPEQSCLLAAQSREKWDADRDSVLAYIEHERSMMRLVYLVYDLLTNDVRYCAEAQEAIIQECAGKVCTPMELSVTDLHSLRSFLIFLEKSVGHLPHVSVPLREMMRGIGNLLGE